MFDIELLIGCLWIIVFPFVVYFMNHFFKKRNGGTSIPQIYVSGIVFYLVGLYPALTLIV